MGFIAKMDQKRISLKQIVVSIVLFLLPIVLRMIPYWVKKYVATALYYASRIYFFAVHFIFSTLNSFLRKRTYVPPPTDKLVEISAKQCLEMILKRELTSSDLIEAYIRRIEQVNGLINAVVVKLFETARAQAKEVDRFINNATQEQLQKKLIEKPLFGIPFTVKDALEVNGETITCGIYNRKKATCDKTAEAVIRMRNAGAILLAVTNVPEVCMWVESVNLIYGRTKNPYDLRRMAGGSSGGEGALIGSAGSLIGIGSDIGGSIRMPAFFNGVFGFKPTPGVIPLSGHMPEPTGYKTQMLRIGPLCRFANDIPIVLKVLAGENGYKLQIGEPAARKKMKVYYMEGFAGSPICPTLNDEMRYAMKRAASLLERKYDIVAQKVDFPLARHVMEFFTLSMHEGTTDPSFNKLMLCDKGSRGEVNCYIELVKWFIGFSNHTLAAIITGIIDSVELPLSLEDTKEMLYKRDRLKRQVKELLGNDGVLLFPSWPTTALFHNEPLAAPFNFSYTALWNVLSVPVVQCPLGLDSNGLPLGVQVIGNQYTDRNLIAVAQDLEESFGGWTAPKPL